MVPHRLTDEDINLMNLCFRSRLFAREATHLINAQRKQRGEPIISVSAINYRFSQLRGIVPQLSPFEIVEAVKAYEFDPEAQDNAAATEANLDPLDKTCAEQGLTSDLIEIEDFA
jgi:hypothetical protein